MSKQNRQGLLVGALALVVVTTGALPAAAQDSDSEPDRTRIVIERQGADGEEVVSRHKVMFVGEDGEVVEIEGEGEDLAWVDGRHGRHVRMHGPGFGRRDGAFLGVSTTPLTPELRAHFGVPEDAGVMISTIVNDSAAFSAGLQVGDIITAVEGEPVESPMDLLHTIRGQEEGDNVTLEIYRDGKVEDVSAVLGKTEHGGMPFGTGHHFRRHGRHFGRGLKVDCDAEGSDCDIFLDGRLDICGDGDACDVKISCEDEGDCTCTVNGEATECKELHGVGMHPDDSDN